MAKKSILKNYLYNLTYQILILILPLITASYLARVLGPVGNGIYIYTYTMVNYFVLFGSLGISMYGQREIAYVQNDKTKMKKVFVELVLFRFITIAIASIIYYFAFMRQGIYSEYYKILIFELIAAAFDISWFFQGLEDFKKTVLRNILVRLTSVSLIFILVKQQSDLNKYLAIYAAADLIGNISLWLYLPKYFKGIKIKNVNIVKQIPAIALLFIPQIANKVYNMLDTTMLGKIIANKAETGYYEQSQKIIRVLLTIVTSLGTVMVPRMASMFANGETKRINEYMQKSFNFTYLLSFPIMFGLIAISRDFVPWFFGPGYNKVIVLMNIISPIILLMGVANIIGTQYLLPTKRQKEFTISVLVGVIVNFVLNFILINSFSSVGACIATVLSQLVVDICQIYFVKDEIDIKSMFKLSYKYLFAGIIMFVSCLFVQLIMVGFKCMIIQIIVGVVVYFGILIMFKDEFIYLLIEKLKEKFLGKPNNVQN